MEHRTQRNGSKTTGSEKTFLDYLAIILRGKWIILATFIVIFGLSILYLQTADRVYEATASVKIDIKALQTSMFNEQTNIYGNLNVIQNELQVLKSISLAEEVAKRLIERGYIDSTKVQPIDIIGGSGGIAPLEVVTQRVQGSVEFEPVRESDVIAVSARSKIPAEAALIANTYAQSYFDRNVFASRTKSRTFRQFLEGQVKDKQAALQKSEEELRRYMEAKGVVSLDDNQRKVVEQLSALQAQHDEADINIQQLEKTLTSYRDQIAQQEQSVAKVMGEANDPYIRLLQDQLAQLEVQRDITVAQNPDFVGKEAYNARLTEIDGQIENLKAKLKKRTDDFLVNLLPSSTGNEQRDPAGYLKQAKQRMLETQIQLQALRARKKALGQSIGDYNRQFENLPKKAIEFARLQREKMSLEKLYLAIEEKYNEANITEQGELGYIDIFDPAIVPGVPSSPKVSRTLMLGALAGLISGFLLVFFREYLKDVIRLPEDLKKRGFTVLSTVMEMSESLRGGRGSARTGDGKAESPQLIMITNPLSPVAESYRQLRSHVALTQSGVRALLVTSPNQGEGKTTTAANLAVAYARTGKKTLLVDADLRRPSIQSIFNLKVKPGLTDVLGRESAIEQIAQKTDAGPLSVLTCGSSLSNPAEVLGSDSMKQLLEEAKMRYDIILFDCPPLLAVTDASILSTMIDRVIIVVSAGTTTAEDLEHAKELLEGVGVQPAGVVLNKFSLKQAYGGTYRRSAYGYYGYAYHTEGSNGDGHNGKVKVRKS